MVNKRNNNIILVTQEARHNRLIKMIIPHAKLNCIGFYKDSLVHKTRESNKNIRDCDILELVTETSINTKNFKYLIKKAGYRILDVIYGQNGFHFFIRKIEWDGAQ